jgi:peroxiredoxin
MQDLTGRPAISFTLRDSAGFTHHLEDYRGQWLLMVFHRHLG